MILNGDWDVITPLENAQEAMRVYTNGHLVTVKGGTHGALAEAVADSPAFDAAIKLFLTSGEMSGLPDSVTLKPMDFTPPASDNDATPKPQTPPLGRDAQQ